ncbi:MAG TPA: hypothetical protein VF210_21455 [Pseudomonadales bacterium]
MSSTTPTAAWWLPRRVPEGQSLGGRIGPLLLDVHRGPGEWQIAFSREDETLASSFARLELRMGGLEAGGGAFDRFILRGPSDRLVLRPLLADRPVVIRPRQPVFLPSGEEITLYMSSPVTVRVEAGEPPVLLRDVPSLAMSDTWFGPSTREGELCYSGRTHARHSLAEVPRRAHRAITPVHIRNEVESPLPLEKVALPVPLLSVYGAADGSLWTENVSLVRTSASDLAALRIGSGPPEYAGAAELISGPREAHGRGSLVRAFSHLFGNGA